MKKRKTDIPRLTKASILIFGLALSSGFYIIMYKAATPPVIEANMCSTMVDCGAIPGTNNCEEQKARATVLPCDEFCKKFKNHVSCLRFKEQH